VFLHLTIVAKPPFIKPFLSSSVATDALSSAVLALTAKLAEAAAQLNAVPASHTSTCLQYVQLIRECSGALEELHELHAKHQRLG
jgi:hypothetical protein